MGRRETTTSAPREPAGRGPSATGPQVRPLPSHGPLCAEPSRRERALLQIPLLRAQHVLRASGSWESASSHCCSQKTATPPPLVIAWFHFPETDALLAVCGLRCIVGGASMLRPPQPLSFHATCWPAAALWRAHLHASPSSCGMAGSAAHRTCERLAIDHLTLLHRATHTLVAQSGVGTAPWTRGTRTRRENPCQASFSRPTGAQSAPLAPPVPPASDGTLRPLRVLLGSRQQRLVAWGWTALRHGPGGGGRGTLSPLKRDIRPVRASPTRASPTLPGQPPLHHPHRPRSIPFPPLRALESSLRIPPAMNRTAGAMSGVRAAQGGLREAPRVELSRRPLSARASGSTDPTETSTSAGSAPSAPSTPIAARPAAVVLMRPGAPAEASVVPFAHPPPAPRPRPHRLPLLRR